MIEKGKIVKSVGIELQDSKVIKSLQEYIFLNFRGRWIFRGGNEVESF